MGILYFIAVATLIATISLSFYNFYAIYHYNFKVVLRDLAIIGHKPKRSEKESITLFWLILFDIFFILAGGMFSAGYVFGGHSLSFIMIVLLIFSNFIALILFEDFAKKPERLVKYASKLTDTPKNILEFKIRAFIFANNEPSYLWDYKRSKGKTYAYDLEDGSKRYREPVDIQYYFPLYRRLLDFQALITHKDIDRDSALINKFIIDNMTLLTTILTILQDEKMVETLSNPLGEKDLIELNDAFLILNVELNTICQFIKKEKITGKTINKNMEMLNTLEEIRSMKNFSKLIK